MANKSDRAKAYPNLKPFTPGVSGNPSGLPGRPKGSRTVFSAAFTRDLAAVWSTHGKATMIKTAENQPSIFFATCAKLLPQDVQLTLQENLPTSLSVEDWAMLRELLAAARESIPNAHRLPPGEVCRPDQGSHSIERSGDAVGTDKRYAGMR
jgi:hypothetical protein